MNFDIHICGHIEVMVPNDKSQFNVNNGWRDQGCLMRCRMRRIKVEGKV
jgi:hypothetical protein